MTMYSIQMSPNLESNLQPDQVLTNPPPTCQNNFWYPQFKLLADGGPSAKSYFHLEIDVGDIVGWEWIVDDFKDALWARDTVFLGLALKSMTVNGQCAPPGQYFKVYERCGEWHSNLDILKQTGCQQFPCATNVVTAKGTQVKITTQPSVGAGSQELVLDYYIWFNTIGSYWWVDPDIDMWINAS